MEKECCMNRTKVRSEEEKQAIFTRINRLTGQMNGVKRMIEENRYCDEILIQLSAIDRAVKSLAGVILENHMHTCLVEDIRAGNLGSIDEIIEIFKRF